MQTFNIHEAKTHLSRLVDSASRGESFIVAKAGKPLVRVSPWMRYQPDSSAGWVFSKVVSRFRMTSMNSDVRKSRPFSAVAPENPHRYPYSPVAGE